ncbi:MAG: hypothetical protein ACE5ES_03600 [Candidatus Nanoarchaeia archaeon]
MEIRESNSQSLESKVYKNRIGYSIAQFSRLNTRHFSDMVGLIKTRNPLYWAIGSANILLISPFLWALAPIGIPLLYMDARYSCEKEVI